MSSFEIDPSVMRLAGRMTLQPSKNPGGHMRGERLTTKKGLSLEYADFRDYNEGDDLRHLDWNALARLGVPIVKQYRDEQDLTVLLGVDTSASMGFGAKLELARQLAGAVGLAALNGGDAVVGCDLGRKIRPNRAWRGRASVGKLQRWLGGLESERGHGLGETLRLAVGSMKRPGLVAIISDFLDPLVVGEVGAVAARGHEVLALQVLSPEEIDPDIEGDLRLVDSETGQEIETTASAEVIAGYKARLDSHVSSLRAVVLRSGGRFIQVSSDENPAAVLSLRLAKEGWVA